MRLVAAPCVVLLCLGCVGEPIAQEGCAHGETILRGRMPPTRTVDTLVLVDSASFPPESAAHLRVGLASLLRPVVARGEAEDLRAGVVITDPCDEDFGALLEASPECPAPSLSLLSWIGELGEPPDPVIEALGCRASQPRAARCAWDPAGALARALDAQGLPRDDAELYVVLVTAGDVADPERIADEVLGRRERSAMISVSLVAGFEGDDFLFVDPHPTGCTGAGIVAAPPTELTRLGDALVSRGAAVGAASLCGDDWAGASASITRPWWIAERPGCLRRRPLVDAEGARCEIVERLDERTYLDSCARLPGRELLDPDDPLTCRIRQVDRPAPMETARGGWYLADAPNPLECFESARAQLVITVELHPGAQIEMRCQNELSDPVDCE